MAIKSPPRSVFNSGSGHSIAKDVKTPDAASWQRVKQGVASIEGETSAAVAERVKAAGADGKISSAEYFSAKDKFSLGGRSVGVADGSIQSAMKNDVSIGRLRVGDVDSFDVQAARTMLDDKHVELDPKVRADLESKVGDYDQRLKDGEILSGAFVDGGGNVHEMAQGRIEVDYEDFVKNMPPENWSPNLARYKGGEVREIERKDLGGGRYEIKQQERMSIDNIPGNLDMTKNTIVESGPEGSRVSWNVFHSDPTKQTFGNKSVIKDDGYIDFSKTDDGKVLVTTHSMHKIDTPGTRLGKFFLGRETANEMVGQAGLRGYFSDVVQNYRDIGEGAVAPAQVNRD